MSECVPAAVGVSRPRRTTNHSARQGHAQQRQRRRNRLPSTARVRQAAPAESYLVYSHGLLSTLPCHYAPTTQSASRNLTTSRMKARRCDSASVAESGSLLTNIVSMTCCPKCRRPFNTAPRRSLRVHSERFPNILGESVLPRDA